MALFMLHQAAEQMYQAILLAFMGYKPTTHNLDKLQAIYEPVLGRVGVAFPAKQRGGGPVIPAVVFGVCGCPLQRGFCRSGGGYTVADGAGGAVVGDCGDGFAGTG